MTYSFTGFTPKADAALNAAVSLASDLGHTYVGTEHLVLALTSDAGVAGVLLKNAGVRRDAAEARLRLQMGAGIPTTLTEKDLTPRLTAVLTAALSAAKTEDVKAGTGHLLQAMLKDRRAAGTKLLAELGASPSSLLLSLSAGTAGFFGAAEKKKGESALEKYGTDLTALAAAGRLDPVHGREAELGRVVRILCRRSKNNPCLIGEAGVGKTAIVEALALKMQTGDLPPALSGKKLISLELNRMVAGAKYRGDFEERIRDVLNEVRGGDVILFIDEVHNLMGAGSAEGAVDAANILKPALSRGEIRLIGATTSDEYRRTVEKDKALSRRFQQVRVSEPSPEKCLAILKCLKEKYERFHGVTISDAALEAAVSLSVRFLPDRFLPDKAIDLMDEACAVLSSAGRGDTVTVQDVENVAADVSGVPVKKLLREERQRLRALEARLSETVIGQEAAVAAVAAAVRRARTGLSDPRRPLASFLFCGEPGVGKTLTAYALAEAVFGSRDAVIVTDLSMYGESHTASGLFGAPPGYVGYGEGETLLKRVKKNPYTVLLFDELEKAHPAIYPELLRLLEEGTVRSPDGEEADCRHTIIIMTSNLPAGRGRTPGFSGAAGEDAGASEVRQRLLSLLPPEFLDRVDEVVVFVPPDLAALTKIARKTLSDLSDRADKAGTRLLFDPAAADVFAKRAVKAGSGARSVRRMILKEVETPLSLLLLGDAVPKEVRLHVTEKGTLSLIPSGTGDGHPLSKC